MFIASPQHINNYKQALLKVALPSFFAPEEKGFDAPDVKTLAQGRSPRSLIKSALPSAQTPISLGKL